ncbi:SLC13 family permease [Alkalilimnicola ehrlichii]|uniref:SLC13 family permease n=1 Tax=Alkalilimnicola ehrlichii TaxID=351052 RepID=A0A3E0WMD4_9GAMM|nr:SLC13 family permease [Alkalilimnicola ehrlichii]RFA26992.1 SLC13 family permease [Alkalilimnicola ehrlichii]RFA34112.1 SLC13 family permease [Alkalilimnicola ehrlichii]
MNNELIIVLSLLAATIVMFAINRPRMDAVALIMMTVLPLTGVIDVSDALVGLSDPNIVLIAALFVIGEGLVRTGVAQKLGDLLIRRAGRNEARLIFLLMVIVTGVGSFMSSTGVVAIFIPVVLRIARNARIPASRLMMPLSVAALISGMMTLVATAPNLVVHAQLVRDGYDGFSFFAFTPFGIPILILAIGYMLIVRRFLGAAAPAVDLAQANRPHLSEWIDEYKLTSREHRLRISSQSSWIGKRLDELDLRASAGINIIAIERRKRLSSEIIEPIAQTELEAGDVLFLDVRSATVDLPDLCERFALRELQLSGNYFADHSQAIGMAELMIPATSSLIGKTVLDTRFRSEYGVTVVGLKRRQTAVEGDLLDKPLKLGDTLLVAGPWRAIKTIQDHKRDLITLNMPAESDDVVAAPSGAPFAIGILALVVGMMVTGVVENVQAALIGCLLLGLFRCVDMNSAYNSIHWQSLILIVGMLPFSIALQNTGGVDLAADALLDAVGNADPRLVLATIFVLTAILGLFISNTATAVLMAPIALAVAAELGLSPYPFAMTVALAASAAFMTPVSSPVNTLVVAPGNYSFFDFVRIGVPFTVVVLITTVITVPLVFPF